MLQNGLRKKIIEAVKTSAKGEFEAAAALVREYLEQLQREQEHAEAAVKTVKQILSGRKSDSRLMMQRKEVSQYLDIRIDTLRNWEMNGLLTVKRKENGYRVYTDDDIKRLIIIRSLRRANYSLESILRMLSQFAENPDTDIKAALNTPKETENIISVCDQLIVSLLKAEKNAVKILDMLQKMKKRF